MHWSQETLEGAGRTVLPVLPVLLVEKRVDLIRDFDKQRQVFAGKTLGTFPLVLFVLVERGELDLAGSALAVLKDSGFDPTDPNLMDWLVVVGHRNCPFNSETFEGWELEPKQLS